MTLKSKCCGAEIEAKTINDFKDSATKWKYACSACGKPCQTVGETRYYCDPCDNHHDLDGCFRGQEFPKGTRFSHSDKTLPPCPWRYPNEMGADGEVIATASPLPDSGRVLMEIKQLLQDFRTGKYNTESMNLEEQDDFKARQILTLTASLYDAEIKQVKESWAKLCNEKETLLKAEVAELKEQLKNVREQRDAAGDRELWYKNDLAKIRDIVELYDKTFLDDDYKKLWTKKYGDVSLYQVLKISMKQAQEDMKMENELTEELKCPYLFTVESGEKYKFAGCKTWAEAEWAKKAWDEAVKRTYPLAYAAGQADQKEKDRQEIERVKIQSNNMMKLNIETAKRQGAIGAIKELLEDYHVEKCTCEKCRKWQSKLAELGQGK